MTDIETPLDWTLIDLLIFDGRIILGMAAIRTATKCGIQEAIDQYSDRYRMLRENCPENFNLSHERYWESFYR